MRNDLFGGGMTGAMRFRWAWRLFAVVGGLVFAKGLWDLFGRGVPEAQNFSSVPWTIVSKAQWLRFSVFETVYGLSCLAVARGLNTLK